MWCKRKGCSKIMKIVFAANELSPNVGYHEYRCNVWYGGFWNKFFDFFVILYFSGGVSENLSATAMGHVLQREYETGPDSKRYSRS
jgi:hypothetical protein